MLIASQGQPAAMSRTLWQVGLSRRDTRLRERVSRDASLQADSKAQRKRKSFSAEIART
jgi:hypothetical protein